MKLSKVCIIGLVGWIIICLNLIINFVTVLSSEYYTPDALDLLLWFISIGGHLLLIVFFAFLLQNSKKLDKILRDL